MSSRLTRRDFLKLTGLSPGGLAFSPYLRPNWSSRRGCCARATTQVSIHKRPDDQSAIVGQAYRDQILNVYEEVNSGHARLQSGLVPRVGRLCPPRADAKVEYIYNRPALPVRRASSQKSPCIPAISSRYCARWRALTPLYRLCSTSVHRVVGLDEGPDGQPQYARLR